MSNILNETTFEEHIANCLASSDLYNQRTSQNFDIETLCDREMLKQFLRQQAATWQMLEKSFPGQETETVIREFNNKLDRGESMLTLFRKGFKIKGKTVRFAQFKPVLAGTDSEAYKLYRANQFSIVCQMRYSSAGADKGNELDMCILLNGLPLFTFELKNEGSGQNYTNGIYQYCYERNPQNRMLRHCLVHFVMDNNYVFMTTKLNGADTKFLPFNQNSTNPPVEGEYPVCYMWQDILQADSILDLLENFIKRYNDEDGRPVVIFPRFHQLRAVRKLRRKVSEEGAGHNYLVWHSAGSGKTKTMAWLAHQLANMTNLDRSPIFDSIVMVTDRIVLNRNMADDVVNFENVVGTVKDIRRGSKNLATALDEGHRIIISTVQKFAFALKTLKREKHRKYAIIVDEAHTAIGNESAKDLVNALSTDEDLKNIPDFNPDEFEDEMDALMAYQQIMRRSMQHMSYFAFTATPKDKTFVLYGDENHKEHDLYSMKQAIDEKFILDVLQNYKSYLTMFELIETTTDEEERRKLYEERKSLALIYGELNKNSYIMLRKATMIVDHFMKHTINKIGGEAKAMVVCDSRRAAADFKRIIDKVIQQNYNGVIKTLVAFSGEVEDSHGRRCTEANMNDDNAHDDGIRTKFKESDYKILIVANKFQTGFDQPLLHTMFVDKSLGGIQCIQTLSRLNRCCEGKEDTMVIDFRNNPEDVKAAFQKYYTDIELLGEVDTQRMYTMMDDVNRWRVFSEDDVNRVVRMLQKKETAIGVPSLLRSIVNERVNPMSDNDKDLYRKYVNRYVRQYGFMAQLMDFVDPELEKFYVFCKVFYKYLPYTVETLPMEILDKIDLDKLRIQMNFEGQLELEDEQQQMISSRIGEPGQAQEDERRTIAEILDIANSPFQDLLNENDKILKQIWIEILQDAEVTDAFAAGNSYDALIALVKEKFDEKVADQIEKYYNFQEELEKNQSFSMMLIRKFVEALAQRTHRAINLPYDESLLKEAITASLGQEFVDVCSHMRSFEEFVDVFFEVLNRSSIPSLDGADGIIKNALNNIYCNDHLQSFDKRTYFNSLLSKYESYLKKLYYLCHGEEVTTQEGSTSNATLANAIHGFDCLWKLKYATTDEGKRFSQYLEMVRKWRNDEAHKAPISTDDEVNAAIKILVAMYLFVTGHSITDLEMAGDHTIPSIAPLHTYSEYDGTPSYGMAAESIDVRDLPEEKRIDLLKQCIVQLTNSSYSKKDAVFTKQRHWEAVYRIAADKGFVIDGDYRYFKHIIDGMSLTNVPELKADTIEKLNKGVYAQAFEDWSPNGLLGKDLSAYNEIYLCGEKFMKIIDAKIPQKK